MRHFLSHVGFRPEKNVCLPTQLGACSYPTGRSTVPYWCKIDVRTPWACHGVSTGPPGPRRAPTAARRPAGGSIRLTFIGGPRFGRPATPIGAGRGYCRNQVLLAASAMAHGMTRMCSFDPVRSPSHRIAFLPKLSGGPVCPAGHSLPRTDSAAT